MMWPFCILCVGWCCSLSSKGSCQDCDPQEGREEGTVLLLMSLNLERPCRKTHTIADTIIPSYLHYQVSCYVIIKSMCLSHTGAWLMGTDAIIMLLCQISDLIKATTPPLLQCFKKCHFPRAGNLSVPLPLSITILLYSCNQMNC